MNANIYISDLTQVIFKQRRCILLGLIFQEYSHIIFPIRVENTRYTNKGITHTHTVIENVETDAFKII